MLSVAALNKLWIPLTASTSPPLPLILQSKEVQIDNIKSDNPSDNNIAVATTLI